MSKVITISKQTDAFDPTSLDGLIGKWDFSTGPTLILPNSAAVGRTTPYVNILRAPERPSSLFSGGTGTITNNAGTDQLGNNNAARFLAGSGNISKTGTLSGVVGNYTVSVYAKSNVPGVPQTVRIGSSGGTYTSATVDDISWTRITNTQNRTWANVSIANDGTNACDVLFCFPQLEPGSSATAYQRPQLDFIFSDSAQTWANGGMSASSNRTCAGGLSGSDYSTYSLYVLVRHSVAGGSSAFQTVISPNGPWSVRLKNATNEFGVIRSGQKLNTAAITNDDAWHVWALTSNGSAYQVYWDGICQESGRSYNASLTQSAAWVVFGFTGFASDTLLYNQTHNQVNVSKVSNYLLGVIAGRNGKQTSLPITGRVVWEGDSITFIDPGIPSRAVAAFGSNVSHRLLAVGGDTVGSQMTTRSTTLFADALMPGVRNVAFLWGGTNDISTTGLNGTAAFNNIKGCVANYRAIAAARNIDLRVVVATTLPRGALFSGAVTETSFNIDRATLNGLILSNSNLFDAIARVDLDPNMGANGQSDNATYYSDKVHPLEPAGNQAMYDIIGPVVLAQLLA